MPRDITNHIPANKLNTENTTETLFTFVNRFAINELKPMTNNAEGIKTVPKFNISNRVNTNMIVPVRNITEPITTPV